jgi:hypothetical protein
LVNISECYEFISYWKDGIKQQICNVLSHKNNKFVSDRGNFMSMQAGGYGGEARVPVNHAGIKTGEQALSRVRKGLFRVAIAGLERCR